MAYHNLNTLTIFPERLFHNLAVLSRLHPGVQPVPVVKSNAYGHGIRIIAPLLEQHGVPFVCVDSLYEAYELEKYGYRQDILIMGYVDPRDVPRRKRFLYAVSTLEYALALMRAYSRVRLHLFFDTGMHREGIGEIANLYAQDALEKLRPRIEGVMSHLAAPDDVGVTDAQLLRFQDVLGQLGGLGIEPRFTHIGASGGLIRSHAYHHPIGNLARTGLAYFGYGHPALLPALRCTTRLIQIKHLDTGDAVGYDGTYTAQSPMKLGVLPIGYHDGMDRRFSGLGVVSVGGQLCPIVGRVSMNLTTIDITQVADASLGQEVTFIAEDPDSPISLERHAERAQMIPYDLLVHMNKEMYRTMP